MVQIDEMMLLRWGVGAAIVIGLPAAIVISNRQHSQQEESKRTQAVQGGFDAFEAGGPISDKPDIFGEEWERGWRLAQDKKRRNDEQRFKQRIEAENLWEQTNEVYPRDIAIIKHAVLADTIDPKSAIFCDRFEVIVSKRGTRVYVGWYSSNDLFGERGKDNIIAEMTSAGVLVKLSIGEI